MNSKSRFNEFLGTAAEPLSGLSTRGAFLLFTWLVLLFFGTIDLTGFVFTGQWHRLILLGIIAACITAICLVMKKGIVRGFTIAELAGLGIASLVIGGSLVLV